MKQNENTHFYAETALSPDGIAVVAALQELGEAAHDAEDRAVIGLGMNQADVLATRYILQATRDGHTLSPTDLAALLDVTTAAASKLVDRLVNAGRVQRLPHPTDKRARIIAPTNTTAADVSASYTLIHTPLVNVINDLPPDEAKIIARFARKLAAALTAAPIHT